MGNVTETIRTLIYNYYLYDHISIQPSVDYLTSLAIMKESDWLLHIDADFKFLSDFGGSVYFAGKIADYLGTNTPILGLTGIGTPAYEIIRRAGGICVKQNQITEIALILADIAEGRITPEISEEYRRKFSAQTVAEKYDAEIEQACLAKERSFTRNIWPEVSAAETDSTNMTKLITICVPAYNVEAYLDRCLHSFVSCTQANKLEVIVVIDGSPDASETIARAYAEKYPHIVKVITKQNGGHGSTINAALKAATGTYFRVVDGDDWVDSRDFAALIQNIEKKQLFPDLISTNYKQVYISDGHTVNWEKNGGQKDYQIFHFAAEDFTNEYFTMASMMVKTEVLRKADFQLQEHTFYVDVEFILFPIPDIKTVMFTPEYVYRYAVGNADQSINPDNFVSRYDHHDRVIRRILSYYAEKFQLWAKGRKTTCAQF
ncbi:glycosyltransferase family 2 protein [Arcanobacterium hippocoleae]